MTIRNDATREILGVREPRRLRGVVARQGQVLLDTDIDALARLPLERAELGDADILGAPGRLAVPAAGGGFAVGGASLGGGKLDATIAKGRGYLDGWLVENPAPFALSATSGGNAQPHPWAGPAAVASPAVVGLKSVVRLIDPVEDEALADRAMGDAQASGRSLVDWQAFALPAGAAAPLACADVPALPAWQALVAPSTGRLCFIKATPPASTDPCSLSESGGYTRLENLLYRVEVHRGTQGAGAPDPAIDGGRYGLAGLQLKLSRSNGSVLARIDKVTGATFKVSPAALDPRNWFAEGQLAELVSIHDDVDLAAAHATERLFRIAKVTDDEVTLVDRSATDTVAKVGAKADGTWFLRMWESWPDAQEVATVVLDAGGQHSTEIPLGDGIAIKLEGDAAARFRRGDYWTCAMRADDEIGWIDNDFVIPMGPQRRYAPLAVVNPGGATEDCRIVVASLADRSLHYRGGDGQEAMPDPTKPTQQVPLATPLRVAVLRGEQPVAGAKVTFALDGLPAGKTAQLRWRPPSGAAVTGTTITAITDATGGAEIAWAIDPTVPVQHVRATLDRPAGVPALEPLVFTANLSLAGQTGFDPKAIAVFAGITDVQRALEALAGMQQAGCATYVLNPENWLATLAKLKPGESAKLCFTRGLFRTPDKVVLAGLGDLVLCGAGAATQIVVDKGECALSFENCASVHIAEIAVDAPESATGEKRGPHVQGRGGTLTLLDCPVVEVTGTHLSCGGQAETERTCLTVRGRETPLKSVRVTDNRFAVGFAQDGVLVVEADYCLVDGNEFEAAPLPEKFNPERTLLAPTFRAALEKALRPGGAITGGIAAADGSGANRVVKAGDYHASFQSDVPQKVWDALAAKNAPTTADLASQASFGQYVNRLMEAAGSDADVVGKYAPEVARLEKANDAPLSNAVRGAMLRTGSVRFGGAIIPSTNATGATAPAAAATSDTVRAVTVGANTAAGAATFRSPVAQADWQAVFRNLPSATPTTVAELEDYVRGAERRILADRALRLKVPGFAKWFDGRAAQLTPWARQAITVAGSRVGDAVVTGNRIAGFGQAVHLGTSRHAARSDHTMFASVTVAGNLARLGTMGDTIYSPAGILVGNAETVRISDNLIEPADPQVFANVRNGIRVYGKIGRFVAIEKNRVGLALFAICLRTIENLTERAAIDHLWLVADNIGTVHKSSQMIKAPPWVERRSNRPA